MKDLKQSRNDVAGDFRKLMSCVDREFLTGSKDKEDKVKVNSWNGGPPVTW
jgi:hypothetical protein